MKPRTTFLLMAAAIAILMFSGHSALLAGPPKQKAPSSNPAKQVRYPVSPEERMAMGVEKPTWVKEHGKVQPEVLKELEDEKKLDPSSQNVMFKPYRPVGFLQMVHVVVHLKVEDGKSKEETRAAIKAVQSSVLSDLTAAEFGRWFRFEDHAAILGFASESGLAKLVKNENVVAIGLDTKPLPMEPPTQFYSQGGEQMDSELSKVSTQVLAALGKAESVEVIVLLKRDCGQKPGSQDRNRQVLMIKAENSVLSRLTAAEFRVTCKLGLNGHVNAAGLSKLNADADVVAVGLPGAPAKLQGGPRRKR